MAKKKQSNRIRLLETIIVIIILAILLGIAFVIDDINKTQARDSERIFEVNNLREALQFYYLDQGYYPQENQWCFLELDCETLSVTIKPYLPELPRDPLYPQEENGRRYSYRYRTTADGQEYKIYTNLEEGGSYELGSKGSFQIPSPL